METLHGNAVVADIRSRNAEAPPHPVHNYKAWVRHQSGFLGLVSQDGEAGPEAELAVPTLHIQVRRLPLHTSDITASEAIFFLLCT